MKERKKLFKYSTTFYRRRQQFPANENDAQENYKVPKDSDRKNVKAAEDCEMELPQDEVPKKTRRDSTESSTESDNLESSEAVSEPDEGSIESEIDVPVEVANNFENNNNTAQEIGSRVKEFLPAWASKNKIPHTPALSTLLKGLTECGIPGLPKDPRTLLGTPQNVTVRIMGTGEFWYHGIKPCLQYVPKYLRNCVQFTVKLDFGIDGLPLHKSSSKQFWPILLKIANISEYPCQVVAIYYGKSKPPSIEEYLEEFCTELNDLIQNGFELDGIQLTVEINAFICDTPARCFIACVVQFNAYHGCLKCTVVGKYYRHEKRMSYPQINCPLRLNNDFRTKADPNHHQKNADGDCISSPLERLPMDMVKDIIIADSLHLIDFGVMKTLLKIWIKGSKNFNFKFFNNQIVEISEWLAMNDRYRPSEIHRALKDLDITNWKATQFHTFMFYRGVVILKDHLPLELYRHFLLFFCALVLCSASHFEENLDLAKELLEDFIEEYISIYGEHSVTSNIHNICHIVEDVKRFGPLPNISSYFFENLLGMLKNLLRNGHKPLVQVVKRMAEMETNTEHVLKPEGNFLLKETDEEKGKKPPGVKKCYTKVNLKNGVLFSSKAKDCWLLTKQTDIIKVKSVYLEADVVVIFGLKIRNKKEFFDYPFLSSKLDIYIATEQFCDEVHIRETNIKCKFTSVEYNRQLVFIPLVHTFDMF